MTPMEPIASYIAKLLGQARFRKFLFNNVSGNMLPLHPDKTGKYL